MRKLPSRGWGPWREEFYSYHSSIRAQQKDVNHEFGSWRRVWIGGVSHFVYQRWPKIWRRWVNTPIMRRYSRARRDLRRCFPNLK